MDNNIVQTVYSTLETRTDEISKVIAERDALEEKIKSGRYSPQTLKDEIYPKRDALKSKVKTAALRIFDDEAGGALLAVSQFTLTASTRKGNRPSYYRAAGHELAVPLYERYCELLAEAAGRPVARGVFGADMQVTLINDGPVTIIIDSHLKE